MKKNVSISLIKWLPLVTVCTLLSVSCKKTFDLKSESLLGTAQTYRNVFDADAAVVGIYGQLQGIAKQYIVLNELRADLMSVTTNADQYLQQINDHNVTTDNPYADPRPFYALINNCNDVLKNFNIMLRDKKMKDIEYQQRYSDIGCIRSWLYLQLGIHYGEIPYVTDPLETIDAVRDASKYPKLQFNVLLDSLVSFTQSLPYVLTYPVGTSLITVVDGSNTQTFFINKLNLLGDLNLWKGNYRQAATYYRRIMEQEGLNVSPGGEQFYNQYRVKFADVAGNNDLAVGYIRFRESDINSLIDNNAQGWRSMFARGQDALFNEEWLWVLPFNSNFNPVNPFIELFSNRGGKYQVKPSQASIDNWNSQLQANNFPYDQRGLFSYRVLGGQPVITKFLYNYLDGTTFQPINPLLREGKWFLSRAAVIHLHFAEAANLDGRRKLSYALVNNGISAVFDTSTAAGRDVTNLQNTLYDSYPYNFDARNGEFPRYRGDWHRHAGIRGRARLVRNSVVGDSTISIDNSILTESSLELAFEGHRWPDLIRFALRRNDPAFLADKIYSKLLKDGNPQAAAVRAKLMNRANWYLPFRL